jgi:hypothetical protein
MGRYERNVARWWGYFAVSVFHPRQWTVDGGDGVVDLAPAEAGFSCRTSAASLDDGGRVAELKPTTDLSRSGLSPRSWVWVTLAGR